MVASEKLNGYNQIVGRNYHQQEDIMPRQFICGCSKVVKHIHDDRKITDRFAGLCEVCAQNDGDYTKSPNWKPDKQQQQLAQFHKKERAMTRQGVRSLD